MHKINYILVYSTATKLKVLITEYMKEMLKLELIQREKLQNHCSPEKVKLRIWRKPMTGEMLLENQI